MIDQIDLYCDGSNFPQRYYSGWAFQLWLGDELLETGTGRCYGFAWEAEFTAFARGLQSAASYSPGCILITTDHLDIYRCLGGTGWSDTEQQINRRLRSLRQHPLWSVISHILETQDCIGNLVSNPTKKSNKKHIAVHRLSREVATTTDLNILYSLRNSSL